MLMPCILLGVIAGQVGKHDLAIQHISQAIGIDHLDPVFQVRPGQSTSGPG